MDSTTELRSRWKKFLETHNSHQFDTKADELSTVIAEGTPDGFVTPEMPQARVLIPREQLELLVNYDPSQKANDKKPANVQGLPKPGVDDTVKP